MLQVSWDEINAAWGLAVLLLHTMAARLGFVFQRYVYIRVAAVPLWMAQTTRMPCCPFVHSVLHDQDM
jgi:hypothetical protein